MEKKTCPVRWMTHWISQEGSAIVDHDCIGSKCAWWRTDAYESDANAVLTGYRGIAGRIETRKDFITEQPDPAKAE